MKKSTAKFSRIAGAFRVLRRRALATKQPGLMVWTDIGEQIAASAQTSIRDEAHRAEVFAGEAAAAVTAGLEGLRDGSVDQTDLEHFQRALRLDKAAADAARAIGEVVRQ